MVIAEELSASSTELCNWPSSHWKLLIRVQIQPSGKRDRTVNFSKARFRYTRLRSVIYCSSSVRAL